MQGDADLARIKEQEQLLQFTRFDATTAWEIGCRLKAAAEAEAVAVAIEIRLAGQTLFFYAMPGTDPTNTDWARRKRNTVDLFHCSSYALGLALKQEQTTLEAKLGLPTRDYASHGGSFPLSIASVGCVGTITVSGLPQREDHALITSVLAGYLGLSPDLVALSPG
ncbi:MAG: heme-degrading domain-containing protein [Herpetosiphon sp.]